MNARFHNIPRRKGTDSLKWDFLASRFGRDDIIPLWVADTDFLVADPIIKALQERLNHGIFGYTLPTDRIRKVVCDYLKNRYNWTINPQWLVFNQGVVPAINFALSAYCGPETGTVVQSPVYYPFFNAVKHNGTRLIDIPLAETGPGNRWDVDLQEFDQVCAEQKPAAFILCSPHNPVGRVWDREALIAMGDSVIDRGGLVISDEIHCDLLYDDHRHYPFGSLGDKYLENSLVLMSCGKSFNIPGLQASFTVIADNKKRKDFIRAMGGFSEGPNVFGLVGMEAAYAEGGAWLKELLEYLQENRNFVREYCRKNIPKIKPNNPEGTYLLWLDCRELGFETQSELKDFFIHQARVGLNDGEVFGAPGKGFMRLNLGTSRDVLKEALERIESAVQALGS